MRRIPFAALLLIFSFLLIPHIPAAKSAEQIGSATKIVRKVTGRISGRSSRLDRGDAVYQNQRVKAGSSSFGQFRLSDGSKLAVNANSSLVLDRFVFSGSASGGKLILKAAKGAFRFATGNMPSNSYNIVTPSSTIGVRGTMFDLYVARAARRSLRSYTVRSTHVIVQGAAGLSSAVVTLSVLNPMEGLFRTTGQT